VLWRIISGSGTSRLPYLRLRSGNSPIYGPCLDLLTSRQGLRIH
jgi:hypothetical protein